MNKLIQTKLMVEIKPTKFLSLGFGDIANSQADIVCVSAFRGGSYAANSSIGALDFALGRGKLQPLLNAADDGQACTMVDVNCDVVAFGKVLVVWMGMGERYRRGEHAGAAIQTGLSTGLVRLQELETPTQLDVTALGCQYGGLHRREIFDHLIVWSLQLFDQCPNVSHVRLVANDLDTFVDFFEALYRLKGVIGKQVTLGSAVVAANYGQFEPEVASASQLLDQNPKQVLVICRTIVEQVIKSLAKMHLGYHPGKLFSGIQVLYEQKYIPPQINSFLHTCRVVGNFANHSDAETGEFKPTRRDAELVILLTLRVVDWFLKEKNGTATHH